MMKATHTDYLHPKHLRVEHDQKDGSGGVWCMAPSCSDYARLNKSSLPKWTGDNGRAQGK